MIDLSTKLVGVELHVPCSLKPEAGSKEQKELTLVMKFDNMTIADAVARAASPVKINFQNANRKNFDELQNGGEYVIEVSAKGERVIGLVTPDSMLSAFGKMSKDNQAKVLEKILANR